MNLVKIGETLMNRREFMEKLIDNAKHIWVKHTKIVIAVVVILLLIVIL